MDRVAIIVLNWNGIEDTLLCFESLRIQTAPNFRIVIVDNGSTDNSLSILKSLERKYNDILTVLYNSSNKGFAGGVNSGINWALMQGFDYIALFNNDAVADRHWLKTLLEERTDKVGVITGLLLNDKGTKIDSTGEQYSTWGLAFPRNRKDSTEAAASAGLVFGATGGATLYSSEVFRDIGVFDEALFAYYEDTDISFRAQIAGWKVFYTPKAIAYHKQGATSSRMPGGFTVFQTFKNLPVVFLKNVPRELLLSIGVRFYFAYLLMLSNAVKNGNGKAAIRGLWASITLIPHSLRERRKIQKAKKVPTSYIKDLLWPDLPPNQTGIRRVRKFFTGKP